MAFAYPTSIAWRSSSTERLIATLVAIGTGAWLIGQLLWDAQAALGWYAFPAPSDAGYLLLAPPVIAALVVAIRHRLRQAEELSVYLDAVAIFLTITALVGAIAGGQMAELGPLGATVALTYPVVHLATAGAGLVALLAVRASPRGGGYLLLARFRDPRPGLGRLAAPGPGRAAGSGQPDELCLLRWGSSPSASAGATGGSVPRPASAWSRRLVVVLGALPVVALVLSALLLVQRHLVPTDFGLVDIGALVVIVLAGFRQTILMHERGRLLDGSPARPRRTSRQPCAAGPRRHPATRSWSRASRRPVYIDMADPSVSDGGRLDYMSPQIEAILGYPARAFVDDPELWPAIIHPADRTVALAAYAEHWTTEKPLRLDYRMIAADDSIVWVHDEAYALHDAENEGVRISQGLLVDTTEQKRLEAQLLHDTLHDPLTGLANRVLFREHAERALARSRRRRSSVALLFLDLDDFKVVNNSLGHRAGDPPPDRGCPPARGGPPVRRRGGSPGRRRVHRPGRASQRTRRGRGPGRTTGDRAGPADRARGVAGSSSGRASGSPLSGSAQIGADDLLAHADAAMYAAKSLGKARHAVFDPSMRIQAKGRLELESALRSAIDNEEFEVHYQPIVALPSRRIIGLEALVRWRDPFRGLVPPDEFIPLAEATGLIVPLGRLVTLEACRRLAEWSARGLGNEGLTISVNVSGPAGRRTGLRRRDPGDPGHDRARSVAPDPRDHGVAHPPRVDHQRGLSPPAARHGVQLAIDDFGTGFSALEYFKRFAVQGLKIDRSFISGLGRSREDTAIVTATLAFASALDLRVTAEGVETPDQLARLEALGCPQAQGYLFSRPVPAAEIVTLLEDQPATPRPLRRRSA